MDLFCKSIYPLVQPVCFFYVSLLYISTCLRESSFIVMGDTAPLSEWWGAALTLNQSFGPGGVAGVSVHQIFSLICSFLHLSVGPALICAVDGGKRGLDWERKWNPGCIEGWEQKICHRHKPLVRELFWSLQAVISHSLIYTPRYTPFAPLQAIIRSAFSRFLFPFIVKTRARWNAYHARLEMASNAVSRSKGCC